MTGFRRANAVTLAAITAMSVWLWAVPAHGSPITVDWDVVPHAIWRYWATLPITHAVTSFITPRDSASPCGSRGWNCARSSSPFTTTSGWTVTASLSSSRTSRGMGAVQEIRPRCEPGLAPCFDAFTPVAMDLSGESTTGLSPESVRPVVHVGAFEISVIERTPHDRLCGQPLGTPGLAAGRLLLARRVRGCGAAGRRQLLPLPGVGVNGEQPDVSPGAGACDAGLARHGRARVDRPAPRRSPTALIAGVGRGVNQPFSRDYGDGPTRRCP